MVLFASPEEIEDLTKSLGHSAKILQQQLQTQEPGLRRLGVGLPAGTLEKLSSAYHELENLGKRLQEQQTELGQLRTLASTTQLINSSLDLDEVLEEVMNRVIQLTGAERGYIMLRNTQTDDMEPHVVRKLEDSEEFIVSYTVVERVVREGETIITTNAQEDSRFMSQESIIDFALRSIICVPLKSREQVTGAIYCDNRIHDGLFTNRETRLLTTFSHQAAIAIENAQFFEQIKQALVEITEIKVLLDNILDSIASGVITTNAEGRITTYNDASEVIFGISRDETVGVWLEEALDCIYPQIRDTLITVLQDDVSTTIETEVEIDERGPLSLKLKLSPLKDAENQTQGVALVVDDLTDLKQRDDTLAAVRRYLPPAMVENIQSLDKLALGGERRTVTVMYVEVRPFDTFPKSLTPKELMEWLNTYHTIGSEAIHHHAGLIDKYMGNEIMCIFNSQLNPSDTHAWDAVQAATRMAADFKTMAVFGTLGEPSSEQPHYRIGIHTGIATMGNVGSAERREFSAIGNNVNLAKRLQENAARGQLIISEETLAQCQDDIDSTDWISIKELEPILVKGISKAVRIYELFDAGV